MSKNRKKDKKPRFAPTTAIFLVAAVVLTLLGTVAVGQAAAGTTSSSPSYWYFAEGYTGSGFQEYLCIANPGASTASATVDFIFSTGGSLSKRVTIKPRSRFTLDVNAAVGQDKEVSIQVTSQYSGLVMERPIYFDYQGRRVGSHCVFGARALSNQWYFAEGYTGGDFDEYICVLNPTTSAASLTFSFQTSTSGEIVRQGSLGPRSRATFKVNDLVGPGCESSLSLLSSQPVVAERPMYFSYANEAGGRWSGGHCVIGTPSLSTQWYFAEGTTRTGFDEWLTLQNPGASAIRVGASFQLGSGQGSAVNKTYVVGPRQRVTVSVPAQTGREKDVSVYISSASPFLAERPIYYGFQHSGLSFEGAQCAMGSPSAQGSTYFAEGYTGEFFEEWLCIQNTSSSAARVEIDYMTQESGELPVRTIGVGAHSRVTVFVNDNAGPNYQLATRVNVLSGSGIVIERPMYFDHTRWKIPTPVPSVDNSLYGMCFSPYLQTDPTTGGTISTSQLTGLIGTAAKYSGWIRTFGSEGEWAIMPQMAHSNGMKIAGGCDIYTDLNRNASEVAALTKQAKARQVDYAVVGDEVLLSNALPEDQLIGYIKQVKAGGVPTGTSDSWDAWINHPALMAACDVILMNIYPYWEGMPVEQSVSYVASVYKRVKALAGSKPVIVETGWPSEGAVCGAAVPSQANSARYLSEFMSWARPSGVPYFYFEAFDEMWKTSREGACGASWGLWDKNGALKPEVAKVITQRH